MMSSTKTVTEIVKPEADGTGTAETKDETNQLIVDEKTDKDEGKDAAEKKKSR